MAATPGRTPAGSQTPGPGGDAAYPATGQATYICAGVKL